MAQNHFGRQKCVCTQQLCTKIRFRSIVVWKKKRIEDLGREKKKKPHRGTQGWQYGTVRSEFAYYVPCTLNRTVPAYRTSVQFSKRTVPAELGTRYLKSMAKKAAVLYRYLAVAAVSGKKSSGAAVCRYLKKK